MKELEDTTTVQKIGKSSLAVIIPTAIAKELKLKKGDFVKIRNLGKMLIYEKV